MVIRKSDDWYKVLFQFSVDRVGDKKALPYIISPRTECVHVILNRPYASTRDGPSLLVDTMVYLTKSATSNVEVPTSKTEFWNVEQNIRGLCQGRKRVKGIGYCFKQCHSINAGRKTASCEVKK